MPGGSGYLANAESPQYARANQLTAPQTDGVDLGRPSEERTGTIWGSLFRAFPRSYALFTGGLQQLAETGTTPHPLELIQLPYQQAWIRPSEAGPHLFRPKLSAFINTALGAANAGRNQGIPFLRGPIAPLPVEQTFAVPRIHFQDQFPSRPDMPWYNRQPGYVTTWPQSQMTFNPMGRQNG